MSNLSMILFNIFSSFDSRIKPDMAKSSFYTIPFKIWEMGKIPFLSWYPGTGCPPNKCILQTQ
jgi:hypothetical protein